MDEWRSHLRIAVERSGLKQALIGRRAAIAPDGEVGGRHVERTSAVCTQHLAQHVAAHGRLVIVT